MDFNPQISKDNNSIISKLYKLFKSTLIFKSLKENFGHIIWYIFAKSQSKNIENIVIKKYAKKYKVDNSFIEFGFGIMQYNCIFLTKLNYKGLLIDASKIKCQETNKFLKKLSLNTKAISHWITKKSLEPIFNFVKENNNKLGVLSIDIDGVDYWVLQEIYNFIKPEIIVAEYNACFGIKSITVPYEDKFDWRDKHESGWYYGASITAFYNLLKEDYVLKENIKGENIVFLRKDKLEKNASFLKPEEAYKESDLMNYWRGKNAKEMWSTIENLPYVEV